MKCLYPITIRNPRFPANPNSTRYIQVPCGKCRNCRANRRYEWLFRMEQELKVSSSACFLTLTYNEDSVSYNDDCSHLTLVPRDLTLFIKRLRKSAGKSSLRYFACGEYGPNFSERPHYHIVMFNLPHDMINPDVLIPIWGKGFVTVGDCTISRMSYVAKYVCKDGYDPNLDVVPPFAHMSRRPALGANYLSDQVRSYHQKGNIRYGVAEGRLCRLPKYYKQKLDLPPYVGELTSLYDDVYEQDPDDAVRNYVNMCEEIERHAQYVFKQKTQK